MGKYIACFSCSDISRIEIEANSKQEAEWLAEEMWDKVYPFSDSQCGEMLTISEKS